MFDFRPFYYIPALWSNCFTPYQQRKFMQEEICKLEERVKKLEEQHPELQIAVDKSTYK